MMGIQLSLVTYVQFIVKYILCIAVIKYIYFTLFFVSITGVYTITQNDIQ